MAARVEDNDRGMQAIVRNVQAFDGQGVSIGVQGSAASAVVHDSSDLSNVELMAIHEFGAPFAGIPERSVVRATFDAEVAKWNRLVARLAQGIYSERPVAPARVLGIVGEVARADMINRINAGIPPALKAATLDRKGSSKPLIDTAQLKTAITWKVRRL